MSLSMVYIFFKNDLKQMGQYYLYRLTYWVTEYLLFRNSVHNWWQFQHLNRCLKIWLFLIVYPFCSFPLNYFVTIISEKLKVDTKWTTRSLAINTITKSSIGTCWLGNKTCLTDKWCLKCENTNRIVLHLWT